MNAYADTSFLVSLYSPDTNTVQAVAEIKRLNPTLLLTPLGELELFNALELRVFRHEATRGQVNAARALIVAHFKSGFFALKPMPVAVYERAKLLARRKSAQWGVRTLDILHVASAALLRTEVFLSFDLRQLKLARSTGLKTS